MKKIALTLIAILVALYLAAYRPWRTGGARRKDSTGGLNVAQDGSRPATGAPDVNQSVKDVQQPVKEVKQRVTDAQGAKRHGKGVKPSMAGMATGRETAGPRPRSSGHRNASCRTTDHRRHAPDRIHRSDIHRIRGGIRGAVRGAHVHRGHDRLKRLAHGAQDRHSCPCASGMFNALCLGRISRSVVLTLV